MLPCDITKPRWVNWESLRLVCPLLCWCGLGLQYGAVQVPYWHNTVSTDSISSNPVITQLPHIDAYQTLTTDWRGVCVLLCWCFENNSQSCLLITVYMDHTFFKSSNKQQFLYPRPTKLEGGYTGFTLSVRLSVCPSVRPSVCRRHGFRSISQVCFGISISNFICMLMVAIGRSLLIFSDVTFKMAAWRPYWIFWFPDSNFTSALNINFKLQRHNTYVYG